MDCWLAKQSLNLKECRENNSFLPVFLGMTVLVWIGKSHTRDQRESKSTIHAQSISGMVFLKVCIDKKKRDEYQRVKARKQLYKIPVL